MEILIIKLGAIGDVLRTTCILKPLKHKFKNTNITWLTKSNALPLLIKNPYINKTLKYNQANIKLLKTKKFNLIINLDEEFEACSLATNLKGHTIGYYLDKNRNIVPTKTMEEWYNMGALGKKPQNDILKKKNKKTYPKVLSDILQINCKEEPPILSLTKQQIEFANRFKRRYNLPEDKLVVGLNTGGSDRWEKKSWSIEHTAELANLLHTKLNAKIILFGGPNEIERNNHIISLSKAPIINAGCGNNLFEFPALINLCHLMITSDSLGLHISLALKRRTIALFGPTSHQEIELYNLGQKLYSDIPCLCCYKTSCYKKPDCMQLLTPNKIFKETKRILNIKTSIIITSFKEPKLERAIQSILTQKTDYKYDLIIAAPDKEAENLVKKYSKKYKNISYFKDPGKGKSYALNLLIKKLNSEILILTDGDVWLGKNSINNIIKQFITNPQVGCVTGRIISANSKNNILGYWSHLLADAGAHNVRKKLSAQNKFLECSGYLFAFKNIITSFPLDVAEDSMIPYLIWNKGYKIKYIPQATVFVKNPTSLKDFVDQRKRTANAHENLTKYAKDFPKVKSFWNEIKLGTIWALSYPKTIKQLYWTFLLFPTRLYIWLKLYYDLRMKKKGYTDGWERIKTTK